MTRRRLFANLFGALLFLILLAVGGFIFAFSRSISSLSGPIHHFKMTPGETFLTDERAATVARDAVNKDGFPVSSWEFMFEDRTTSPDGRPDKFMTRDSANGGVVCFLRRNPSVQQRFVHIELKDGEITAQGILGK